MAKTTSNAGFATSAVVTNEYSNPAYASLYSLGESPTKKQRTQRIGFDSHVIGSCQNHHPFSTAPIRCDFRYVSTSTSLRNRLLLYAIFKANDLQCTVEKIPRAPLKRLGKENFQIDALGMFPKSSVSRLSIVFPERQKVHFYHDSTIFLELASRYNLLGNNEQIESLSKSMISSFARMDELAFNQDRKAKAIFKTVLEQEYRILSTHLESKPMNDFSSSPALECCFLATTFIIKQMKAKYQPQLPLLISNLYNVLLEKYKTVTEEEEAWWEDDEMEEEEEEEEDTEEEEDLF